MLSPLKNQTIVLHPYAQHLNIEDTLRLESNSNINCLLDHGLNDFFFSHSHQLNIKFGWIIPSQYGHV